MSTAVVNRAEAYKQIVESLLSPEDRDFDAEGSRMVAVLGSSLEEVNLEAITLFERVVIAEGRSSRYDAAVALLNAAGKADHRVFALAEVNNAWHVPEDQPWEGETLANCPWAKSMRNVILVDVDGTYVQGTLLEDEETIGDTTVREMDRNSHVGVFPHTLMAALRGTKPPHCYHCGGRERLRPYGGIVTVEDREIISGIWACPDLEDGECQKRANRKFSPMRQKRTSMEIAKSLTAWVLTHLKDPKQRAEAAATFDEQYRRVFGADWK